MTEIPISFELTPGKYFHGYFKEIKGSAGGTWHLYTKNNRHQGQLIINSNGDFAYYGQKPGMDHLSRFFEDYLIAWYE